MENFRTYITEAKNKGLTIFDIDDTMFKTKARVKVMPSGKDSPPIEWFFGGVKASICFFCV